MIRRSLRARLLFASALTISAALGLAGFGLFALSKEQVAKLIEDELRSDLLQIANDLDFSEAGNAFVSHRLGDPRFHAAYGGRYWQVNGPDGLKLRSRSLWDTSLEVPPLSPSAGIRRMSIAGPNGSRLLALSRALIYENDGTEPQITITSAVDEIFIDKTLEPIRQYIWIGLALVSLFLVGASWLQMTVGLGPFNRLRHALAAVSEGRARRVEGWFPVELEPLIVETNTLLSAQENTVAQARARASDLAHGLKTPLAIFSALKAKLDRKNEPEIAGEIEKQIEAMKRHLERELARARARGGARTHHARIDARAHLLSLLASMQQVPEAEDLEWSSDLPGEMALAVDRDDLTNLIANLLDNAQKWAASRIHLKARTNHLETAIAVEDDGPGIAEAELASAVKRGERLDQTIQGTGLGLAIVSDIVALYDGRLELAKSRLGGLAATIVLPTPN